MPRRLSVIDAGFAMLFLLVTACGHSAPSESEAAKAVRRHLEQFGDVVDFHKTDGHQREESGLKTYTMYIRGAAEMPEGSYLVHPVGNLRSMKVQQAPPRPPFQRGARIPEDTIYVIEGQVLFSQTENGWKRDRWNPTRAGLCPATKRVSECYAEQEWD